MWPVYPPLVREPWLLLAHQWEGFTQADQLKELIVTPDNQPPTTLEDQLHSDLLHRAEIPSAGFWSAAY